MNGLLGFGLSLLGVLVVGSLVMAGIFHVAAFVERRKWEREMRLWRR